MKIYGDIRGAVTAAVPELRDAAFDLQPSPENQPGDFGLACFRFANVLGEKPHAIAERIAALEFPEIIAGVKATGPYVNFTLNRSVFAAEVVTGILDCGAAFGSRETGRCTSVILEHTSINPNASPHIGRARNGLIGDTLARLLRFEGYEVNVHYYVNDMGKQIGLLYLQTRGRDTLEFHEVLDLYVEANRRAEEDPDFEAQGFDVLGRVEQGDREVVESFGRIVDICLEGQLGVLTRLGLSYDTFDRESSFLHDRRMKEVMALFKEKEALFTDEEGRTVVDLKPLGYPRDEGRYIVLMRANGSTMYMYRDIAYTLEKIARGSDHNIIVLGEDHKMYFEQMAVILRALDREPPEAVHYSYILLREGKMSTRQGTVVLLEDFLDEAIRRARVRVDEQCSDLPDDERADIARMIGLGAVRFAILSVRPNRNVVFEWDAALSFTGDSGPYIQYSCTRIASILRKYEAGENTIPSTSAGDLRITHDAEWDLVFRIAAVENDIAAALETRNPGIIANTALDIAKKFSAFYNACPVLAAPDEHVRSSRRALCIATRQVLVNLLGLLGIEAPERM